jgi:outer membrane protein assembly factor BamB
MRVFQVVVFAAFGLGSIQAADAPWPQFRGPGGSGIAEDAKVPEQIGPDKNLAWKVAVPPGMSSPVIAGDRLFLTAFENNKLYTIAYRRTDGKELWRKEAPAKKIEAYLKTEGSPAASTSVTDGEKVISYFGSCGLICYDLDGNELWKYELPVAETNNDFGTGSSPVLADGKVVLLRDQLRDARLICVEANNGSLVWEKKREGVKTSWGSACIWDTPQGKQVVVPGSNRVEGYDLKNGKEIWKVTGTPAVPCTTPVAAEGKLYFAGWAPGSDDFKMPSFDDVLKQSGEEKQGYLTKKGSEKTFLNGFFDANDLNKDGKITREEWDGQLKFLASGKNIAFALTPGGRGDVTKTHVAWSTTKGLPYIPSPLIYRGILYTMNNGAKLSAFDAKTGKEIYDNEAVGLGSIYASPVAANGRLYLCGLDKSVVVVKAGDSPDKLSSAKLDDRIAATPAIAGGTIYIRTAKSLYAFSQK